MKSRIKFSDLFHETKSFFISFFRKNFGSTKSTGFSKFHHYFTMFLFNNKVRVNVWQNIIQKRSACRPSVSWSFKSFFRCISISAITGFSKNIIQPINQCYFCISNRNYGMKVVTSILLFIGYGSYIEASFSIYNSSEISPVFKSLVFSKISKDRHINSLVNHYSILNQSKINVQADRLSEKDSA